MESSQSRAVFAALRRRPWVILTMATRHDDLSSSVPVARCERQRLAGLKRERHATQDGYRAFRARIGFPQVFDRKQHAPQLKSLE